MSNYTAILSELTGMRHVIPIYWVCSTATLQGKLDAKIIILPNVIIIRARFLLLQIANNLRLRCFVYAACFF